MLKGIQFVKKNFEKSIEVAERNIELYELLPRIKREYSHISKAKLTGDLYLHFLEFKNTNHKYSDDFKVFRKHGILPNEDISDYLEKNYPEEIKDYTKISDFVKGEIYTNSDIRFGFRCTYMGGIRPSKKTNTIVIICDHMKSIYDDYWKDGVLHYTGQGKNGNQTMDNNNLSLKNAESDGRTIHLFEKFFDKEFIYQGEVKISSNIYTDIQKDDSGKKRQVFIFPLSLKDNSDPEALNKQLLDNIFETKVKKAKRLPLDKLRDKAREAKKKVGQRKTISNYIYRDPNVSLFVKLRANGVCDLCDKPAPFILKNKEPYLESHHVLHLSKTGEEGIHNAVALCPNCHRKMHSLNMSNDRKKLFNKIEMYLINSNDYEYLNALYKLNKK